jgi:glycosyltransferase involved in cell wall biosynthesis
VKPDLFAIDPNEDGANPSAGELSGKPQRDQPGQPTQADRGVSVLILTRNEEQNIAACLASLGFADEIVVLDSESTDRTVEIALRDPRVRVVTRAFDTEYKQRNFGLHDVSWKNAWVYVCDADERVPPDLAAELVAIASKPVSEDAPAAYRMRFRNMFRGKWIRHCAGGDVWILRFVRPALVRYEKRETNVHPVVSGTVGELSGRFIHYSFNAGLKRWFEKHNYYSSRESAEAVHVVNSGRPPLRMLRDADPMVRRRAMKNLSFFLPARWAWRFVFDFIIKRGFMDGWAGFHYCAMISSYEYWIELKMKERRHDWRARNEAMVAQLLDGEFGSLPTMASTLPNQ